MFQKPQPYLPFPKSASVAQAHAGYHMPSSLEHIDPIQGMDPNNLDLADQHHGPPANEPGNDNGNKPDKNAAPRGGNRPLNDPDDDNGGGGGGGGLPSNSPDDDNVLDAPPNPYNLPDPSGAQFLVALQAISNNLTNFHQQATPPKTEKIKGREPDTFDGSDPQKF